MIFCWKRLSQGPLGSCSVPSACPRAASGPAGPSSLSPQASAGRKLQAAVVKGETYSESSAWHACEQTNDRDGIFLLGLFSDEQDLRALVMGSSEKAKFVKRSSFVEAHRLSQLPALQMSHSCSPPRSKLQGSKAPWAAADEGPPLSRCHCRPGGGLRFPPTEVRWHRAVCSRRADLNHM